MSRARVKIIKRKVVVRRTGKGGWERVRSGQKFAISKPAPPPPLPDLPALYNEPSLLLLGLAGGHSSVIWQRLWRLSRLWSPIHPRAAGQIFQPGPFGVQPLPLNYTNGDDTYEVVKNELYKYPRGFILHDVVQPHLVARFVSDHRGYFRVVLLADDTDPAALDELTPLANRVLPYDEVAVVGDDALLDVLAELSYPPP